MEEQLKQSKKSNALADDVLTSEETIKFSLSKHTSENVSESRKDEKLLLNNKKIPTTFEDVFSKENLYPNDLDCTNEVVGIEEVFQKKAEKINRDFHDDTSDEIDYKKLKKIKKERRAALIAGLIAAIIVAAGIVSLILILK